MKKTFYLSALIFVLLFFLNSCSSLFQPRIQKLKIVEIELDSSGNQVNTYESIQEVVRRKKNYIRVNEDTTLLTKLTFDPLSLISLPALILIDIPRAPILLMGGGNIDFNCNFVKNKKVKVVINKENSLKKQKLYTKSNDNNRKNKNGVELTKNDWAKIKSGLTKDQVLNILGEPYNLRYWGDNIEMKYKDGGSVTLDKNGKVWSFFSPSFNN